MKKILTIVFVLFFLTESFSQLKKIESKALDVISTGPQLDYVLKHAILCSNSALKFSQKIIRLRTTGENICNVSRFWRFWKRWSHFDST